MIKVESSQQGPPREILLVEDPLAHAALPRNVPKCEKAWVVKPALNKPLVIIEGQHRSGIRVVKHVSPHVGLDLLEMIERSRKLVSEWCCIRFNGIYER